MTNINNKSNINTAIVALVSVNQINKFLADDQMDMIRQSAWVNAFNKAEQTLTQRQVFSFNGNTLAIASSDNSQIYITTRTTCQCPAFTQTGFNGETPKPCYHRAVFTLLTKYQAVLEAAA
jgi:predicted double-glycine peptidase